MDVAVIFDKLYLGLTVFNEKMNITFCNRTAKTMFLALDKTERHFLANELKELVQQSRTQAAPRERLLQFKSQNRWIAYRVNTEGIDAQYQQIMVTLQDATTRSRLEQTVLKAENLSVVGQLAMGAMTEIKNPLTAARGFCQLLNESDAELSPFIDLIGKELDTIKSILDEFIRIASSYRYFHPEE